MNLADNQRRMLVLKCLTEGTGIRAVARISGCSRETVLRLFCRSGRVAAAWQDRLFRDLRPQHLQIDEAWSFVYCKEKNLPDTKSPPPGAGTVWLWAAIDPGSKIVTSWVIGDRELTTAVEFLTDLKSRIAEGHRPQLTSDGHKPYRQAVELTFGRRGADYALVVKEYKGERGKRNGLYSGSEKAGVFGSPDLDRISTSFIERVNLTVRQTNKRFGRKTNGFSKQVRNHAYSVALGLWSYNLSRRHQTLSNQYGSYTTPAMAAGVLDRPLTLTDLLAEVDRTFHVAKKRGRYRKRQRAA